MAVRDVILIGILIFTFGCVFFIIHFMMTTVTDRMLAIPAINESSKTVEAFQGVKNAVNRLDYVIVGLFVALCIGLIVTSFLVGGHPLFMIFYIIMIILGIIISVFLSNVWETISTTATITSSLAYFPITNHLLLKLPFYIAGVGFIGMVVMFAKPFFRGEA